jgi:hypothetical protein
MRKVRLYGRKIPWRLYHWAPLSRLKSIRRHGLRIGSLTLSREWRPPWLCFSDSPARALMLCTHIPVGTVLVLFEVFPQLRHRVYRVCRDRARKLIPEWRIYDNVSPSRIFRIASRKKDSKKIPTV